MAILLFLGLLAVPAAEIVVFIQVGGAIGLWPTLGLVIATAIAGAAVLRHQGLSVIARARQQLSRNQLPIAEIFDGACLVLAAVLLLTPGFVTDVVGATLLIPSLRHALRGALTRLLHARVGDPAMGREGGPAGSGTVIDGDYEVVNPEHDGVPARRLPEEPES